MHCAAFGDAIKLVPSDENPQTSINVLIESHSIFILLKIISQIPFTIILYHLILYHLSSHLPFNLETFYEEVTIIVI